MFTQFPWRLTEILYLWIQQCLSTFKKLLFTNKSLVRIVEKFVFIYNEFTIVATNIDQRFLMFTYFITENKKNWLTFLSTDPAIVFLVPKLH